MTTATASEELLTLAEAAALCGRSEKTVARWVAAGKLPARRVLGRVRIARADLEALLVPQRVGGGRREPEGG
jgi:excisionase family DNA binding protein